ncbi:DUF4082 domain-containing protein [Nostocaceae cyanobacterium CENA369]|uniref:DUF4082 domain-containing protein n=1 Tax=Dendronalium phyllosphericum CENA369 TaxID=1725256 RepID=A0A8J7I0N3_9NOST|nr:DUF4082 domain-containing protein [Dendronalium phyllosphericum]MBH8573810.1 DUF4082 domain-containing protein [Dendronalium phyllosphericum CENA369]
MKRRLRYIILFCCTLFTILLIFFWGQSNESVTAQNSTLKSTKNSNAVTAIAYSKDGKTLVGGTKDGRVIIYDPATGKEKQTLSATSAAAPVTGVVFSSDGILNSVGKDSVLRRWNATTGKLTQNLTGHEEPIEGLAVSPDGKLLATGGQDTKVFVWDAATNKLKYIVEEHKSFVKALAFSPDSKILASADEQGLIYLSDTEKGQTIQTLLGHADSVNEVVFSPNGKTLASVSDDGTARLWDVGDVKNSKQLKVLRGATKALKTVAFTSDGKTLIAGGDDQKLSQWDVTSGNLTGSLIGHNAPIKGLTLSPDGLNFVSADENGDIKFWDAKSRVIKRTIQVLDKTTSILPIDLNLNENKSLKNQTTTKTDKAAVNSSEQTLIADVPSPPGGPILLITNASNPFSNYYTEILRNEGLNTFNVSDISSVSATTLANYDVAILAETTLTSTQVTTFTNWVTGGGNLIAMRPDKQLASLLGLTDAASTLPNAYLRLDTSTDIANGLVNQTIQFHGTADRYSLNGASSIATLYTNATTATSNPALTLRSVGSNGGQAAAFTYDLARSVIYTRQGNPAWATQERDSFSPIRSDDLYFGNASGDVQPDWVDLNKVAIPQADEQQRLLANLILKMNLDKKPLPRFWYFPQGKKAVVLMTGDDHANGGTAGRFDQFKASSPPGCSVDNWECIRGTSYIYPNSPLTSQQAASYTADGFEVSLHVNTGCGDFTPATLETFYTQQLSDFTSKYASIPAPITERHHCLVWSDWFTTPQVELNHGIRLDTTYYYWPPTWVNNRPGFFTGSGMAMRLANQNGTMIDVYNSATQLTDESGQTYPSSIDTLLDGAIGEDGYYGIFNVNAHTDAVNSDVANAVVASAQTRGIPIVSAKQLLTWLDGRNSSSFGSLAWSNNTLTFTITQGTGINGLQAMLPNNFANLVISSITRNGSAVTYTPKGIKGIEYAFFPGNAGSYVVTYTQDTTPPTVSSTSPSNGATSVSTVTSVAATFSEAIAPTTINTSNFELRNQANALVAATVTYDEATRIATLTPSSSLATSTIYNATIKGGATGVKDLAGNALAANFTWSFTTASTSPPQSIWNSSATPTNPSSSDTNAVELGVKFRSDVNGSITGIRFYKGNGNTGTHIGNLWSSSGTQLATATFSNETASGWQQVNFNTPVAITANTVYVASYHTDVGHYASDNNFFAASGVDNPPLHALRDGENGGNGVYNYGASSFPNNTFQSTNYWVDVVFTTNTGPDTTPPTVSSKSPANSATGVSAGTSVTATFSEAMNSATISTNTFQLQGSNNTPISATVSYNATNFTATLTPSSPLAASTTYTATVKGGTTGVKDQAGNALAANYTWSFTTASGTQSSLSIWNSSATPTNPSENDTDAVEVGVKFRSDVNGSITAIRFYKGSGNTGTHIGNLWSSSGTLLRSATFSNETASGWQQVNFSTPVAITANTVYVASYHTNVGRYAADSGFFATAGVDNSPLHALRDGVSGGNGVYKYGASGFPNSTFQSSNYWVDVVLTTN